MLAYDHKEAIEMLARGSVPAAVIKAAEYYGWAEQEAGEVFAALYEFLETLEADVLLETGAAAEAFARHLDLSPEAKQYILSFMGRAGKHVDAAAMNAPGLTKRAYGKVFKGRVWGRSEAVEAQKAGTFGGTIRLSRRSARGARG